MSDQGLGFGIFWESFKATWKSQLAVVGLIIAVLAWFVDKDATVSIKAVLAAMFVLVLIIVILIDAVRRVSGASPSLFPKVIQGITQKSGKSDAILCLLEASPIFTYAGVVSIFISEDGKYEELIALGEVVNIQGNGLIQIIITRRFENGEKHVSRIAQNDASVLKLLVVKPSIPASYMNHGE